jgi:hypothetical protein
MASVSQAKKKDLKSPFQRISGRPVACCDPPLILSPYFILRNIFFVVLNDQHMTKKTHSHPSAAGWAMPMIKIFFKNVLNSNPFALRAAQYVKKPNIQYPTQYPII